jgi:holo-[acyl-carrier protein] synthase
MIGIDACSIRRFARFSSRSAFVETVFSGLERAYCERQRTPAPLYAEAFAAKEAFFKAVGTGVRRLDLLRRMSLVRDGARVRLELDEPLATLLSELGQRRVLVSVCHDENTAYAVVVTE